jgi:hypothetical protein
VIFRRSLEQSKKNQSLDSFHSAVSNLSNSADSFHSAVSNLSDGELQNRGFQAAERDRQRRERKVAEAGVAATARDRARLYLERARVAAAASPHIYGDREIEADRAYQLALRRSHEADAIAQRFVRPWQQQHAGPDPYRGPDGSRVVPVPWEVHGGVGLKMR